MSMNSEKFKQFFYAVQSTQSTFLLRPACHFMQCRGIKHIYFESAEKVHQVSPKGVFISCCDAFDEATLE